MKHITFSLALLLVIGTVTIFAQNFENESEIYPKTLQIAQASRHAEGMRVDYIRQNYTVGTFWAPNEWFSGPERIGEIFYGDNKAYPYVTFYFKDGALDHFRLYLSERDANQVREVLESLADDTAKFPPAESTPEIDF